MNKLKLLRLAEEQDCEAINEQDLEEENRDFKKEYQEFYNDVKQKSKHIKEDW